MEFIHINHKAKSIFPEPGSPDDAILITTLKQWIRISFHRPYTDGIECTHDKCGCRHNPMVWVSDKLKAIYYEVPKVASSSLKKALDLPNFDYQRFLSAAYFLSKKFDAPVFYQSHGILHNLIFSYQKKKFTTSLEQHGDEHVKLNTGKYGFYPYYGDPKSKSGYFSFTFIRSPEERFISNWAMFNQKPNRKKILEEQLGREFVNLDLTEFIEVAQEVKNHHWESQVNFLPGQPLERLDFIGKMESMNQDLNTVLDHLGINDTRLPTENKTSHKKAHDILTADQIRTLKELYKSDIELHHISESKLNS